MLAMRTKCPHFVSCCAGNGLPLVSAHKWSPCSGPPRVSVGSPQLWGRVDSSAEQQSCSPPCQAPSPQGCLLLNERVWVFRETEGLGPVTHNEIISSTRQQSQVCLLPGHLINSVLRRVDDSSKGLGSLCKSSSQPISTSLSICRMRPKRMVSLGCS